jgi:hypothetical protein
MGVSTLTTSGRPDGRVESYLYSNQFVETREFSFNFTEQQFKDRVKELELEQISGDVSFIAPYYFNGVTITTAYNTGSGYFITDTIGNDTYFASIGDLVYIFGDNGKLLVIRILTVGIQLQLANRLFIWAGSSTYGNRAEIVPELCIGEFNNATDIQTGFPVGTKLYICSVKQNNHLSQGTRLHTDIIGSIENYPSSKLNRLAENKPLIGQYLLLVDDSGDGLIFEDTNTAIDLYNIKADSKVISWDFGIRITDGVYGSAMTDLTFDSINNEFDSIQWLEEFMLFTYTAQNTTQSSATKQVIDVESKVIATNSHSIYKGSAVGNCIGKVLTGNGTNEYESKVLDNNYIRDIATSGWGGKKASNGVFTLFIDDLILIDTDTTNAKYGDVYKRVATNGGTDWSRYQQFGNIYLEYQYNLTSVPIHSTLQLDSSTSAAVKYFNATSVENRDVFVSRFLEEMIWDYDEDTSYDNPVVDGLSSTNTVSYGNIYQVSGGDFDGYRVFVSSETTTNINITDAILRDGQFFARYNGNPIDCYTYDGNGFGDSNKFELLTNGTSTDLNGNVVTHKVISQFTGFKYKGGN